MAETFLAHELTSFDGPLPLRPQYSDNIYATVSLSASSALFNSCCVNLDVKSLGDEDSLTDADNATDENNALRDGVLLVRRVKQRLSMREHRAINARMSELIGYRSGCFVSAMFLRGGSFSYPYVALSFSRMC